MRLIRDRPLIAVWLAFMLLVRPVVAAPPGDQMPAGQAAVPGVVVANAATILVAVLELQRGRLAEQLVGLGKTPAQARAMVAQLSPGDIAVLVDNPRMMQVAGATSARDLTLLWGILIIAGLIALAAATDGSISFG